MNEPVNSYQDLAFDPVYFEDDEEEEETVELDLSEVALDIWRARMWNTITSHPDIKSSRVLFSGRNRIANYVTEQAEAEVGEMLRQHLAMAERWRHDHS